MTSNAVSTAITMVLRVALQDRNVITLALADAEDPVGFATQLLRDASLHVTDDTTVSAKCVLSCLPPHASYVDQLAAFLAAWSSSERCPLLDQSTAADGVSVLTTSRDHVLSLSLPQLNDFISICIPFTESDNDVLQADVMNKVMEFLQALGGARGVLTCLGFRETVGSRTIAPLTREQCFVSFQQLHSKKGQLTVGARAFTKHCARSSDGFWGEFKGSDLTKNATALTKLENILDHAVWKNIHSLPHGEATFELRDKHGYGARWYIRDESFRGFLEPHMENGHENRWRH